MDKPVLDATDHTKEGFYALVGRVSLLLIEHNVDAITVANFLREIAEAGGSDLNRQQVIPIAQHYVDVLPVRARMWNRPTHTPLCS